MARSGMKEWDDDLIRQYHDAIDETLASLIEHISDMTEGEVEFEEDELDRCGDILKTIIPFFTIHEAMLISSVLRTIVNMSAKAHIVKDMMEQGADMEAAKEALKGLLTEGDALGMGPDSDDPEVIKRRLGMANPVDLGSQGDDPASDILRRMGTNLN